MKETELKIRTLGDPVLRRSAKNVLKLTDKHKEILSKMAQLMYDSKGIGLAAPQVGVNEAMLVVDVGTGLYKIINPKILKKKGSQTREEGCLSVPEAYIKVKRAKKVLIQAQDENFNSIVIDAEDLLACVFQHEMDHLKGKLIVDYASLIDKIRLRKKIRELKKQNERLPESEAKSGKL